MNPEEFVFAMLELEIAEAEIVVKGGPGSGHWGHAGRPGSRGGSVGGNVAVSLRTGRTAAERQAQASGGGVIGEGQSIPPGMRQGSSLRSGEPPIDVGANEFLGQGLEHHGYVDQPWSGWEKASDSERGIVKADIVSQIAQDSGVDEETVNAIIGQWSETSNDNDMRSLSLQRDASAEFGIPFPEFAERRIGFVEEWRKKREGLGPDYGDPRQTDKKLYPITDSETQRKVLRAMYNHTQRELERAGFGPNDLIFVYRGTERPRSQADSWIPEQSIIRIGGNPLSSWSVSPRVAHAFRHGTSSDRRGVVFGMRVPRSAIFSTARTGIGCLSEGEFVILTGKKGHSATVIELSPLFY